MSKLRRLFKIKRGFTLMECVLAMAILAATSAILLPTLSSSYNFINNSQSLDSLTSAAEYYVNTMPYSDIPTTTQTDSNGYIWSYDTDSYYAEVHFYSESPIVDFPVQNYKVVATIVKDGKDNAVVIYAIDPNELKGIYARK